MKTVLQTLSCGALFASAVTGAAHSQDLPRYEELPVAFSQVANQTIIYRRSAGQQEGGIAGNCPPQVSSHTNANFEGGQFVVQAGFSEGESAACSYTIPAAEFPIRLDMAEMIFATSGASVSTTTHWSFTVWKGNPSTGTQIFTVSSDGKILPHLVMPPGTTGTNIQFMIDPGDPEQIYIDDDGSHTFSISYRIDQHHAQTQNPCFVAPPATMNAFPTTDVGGLQNPTQNWLYALNCGLSSCAGWKRFSELPQGICRPSGDWVMRATWTSLGNCQGAPTGACCQGTSCNVLTLTDCNTLGGIYKGDGVVCGTETCAPTGPGPCCFTSTGGCINLLASSCVSAAGIPGPAGVSCTGYVCFPMGACCLTDGSCVGPVSPAVCASMGGTYKGNNTTCATVSCPPPTGAACFATGFCIELTQADAAAAGATWKGAGTTCADGNDNGTADACEQLVGDLNHDGRVDGADLGALLGLWGQSGTSGDLNNDGTVDGADLGVLLGAWTL
jgi:hypothetical protein